MPMVLLPVESQPELMMEIQGAVALVTGANWGLGRAVVQALLRAGAARVYAGSRQPAPVTDSRVIPVTFDVIDAEAVASAARQCAYGNLVINNAGVAAFEAQSLEAAHDEMQTNYYGTLLVLYWRKDDFLIVLLRVVQHNFSFNQISGVVNFRIIFYISLTLGLRGFRSERHR
jgi:nucleoside-diphosphate-sugar epimerase